LILQVEGRADGESNQGLQAGAADVNHAMIQMIQLLGQGTKADLVELDRVMGGLSEQLGSMAGLAAMYDTLNSEDGNRVKDAVTNLCSDLDSMFKTVSDIFNKNELAIEVRLEENCILVLTTCCSAQNRVHFCCQKSWRFLKPCSGDSPHRRCRQP
jgi:hypothetical protein